MITATKPRRKTATAETRPTIQHHTHDVCGSEYIVTIRVPMSMPGAQALAQKYVEAAQCVGASLVKYTQDHWD